MPNNTIISQRTLTNSWADTPLLGVPSGIIVDISITTIEEHKEAYITQLNVSAGKLHVIIRDQNDRLLATLASTVTGIPVALDGEPGTIGTIVLGYIPVESKKYLDKHSKIRINPTLVHHYYPDTPKSLSSLFVSSDDVTIFDSPLYTDMILIPGTDIAVDTEEGVATISTTTTRSIASSILYRASDKKIYTINNTYPNSDGNIYITVTFAGEPEIGEFIKTTSKGSYITIDSTNKIILNALKPVDLIDTHIEPTPVREFKYYPLDDAYYEINTDTMSAERTSRNAPKTLTKLTSLEVDPYGKVTFSEDDSPIDETTELYDITDQLEELYAYKPHI